MKVICRIDGVDQEVCEITQHHLDVIGNEIPSSILIQDLKRRVEYILMHKYKRCLKRMKDEWIPKLQENGVESIPLNDQALVDLILQQDNYKNAQQRQDEAEEEE